MHGVPQDDLFSEMSVCRQWHDITHTFIRFRFEKVNEEVCAVELDNISPATSTLPMPVYSMQLHVCMREIQLTIDYPVTNPTGSY